MDDESIKNLNAAGIRLWESFAPVREFVEKNPELKKPIIKAIGKVMTESFRDIWAGPVRHD